MNPEQDITTGKAINWEKVRKDFPILQQQVNGHPLVYLDNAATAQKPKRVITALEAYYSGYNSNIHRGVHYLASKATEAFEGARNRIAEFIGTNDPGEIIFTSGTTEGINLVASSWGRASLRAGDEILLSGMEHHSNIVPWQLLAEQTGATIKVIPVSQDGSLPMDSFRSLLSERCKVLAITQLSNALGTVNPVKEMVKEAHAAGAVVLVDAAQSAPHLLLDVKDLECDFLVFSGHKLCGPTGTGVLYGRRQLLESMPPYKGGGEMIAEVTFNGSTWNELPWKFEAGTPNIGGVIALGEAVAYLQDLGMEEIAAREHELHLYQEERLRGFSGLRILGEAPVKGSLSSFVVDSVHPFDIGSLLDQMGIAVRTGHHCTQPLMRQFGIPGTVRSSLSFYNTREDVDRFITALGKALKMLR
jgi:cysteine desulfurase/selenocysteine lyase